MDFFHTKKIDPISPEIKINSLTIFMVFIKIITQDSIIIDLIILPKKIDHKNKIFIGKKDSHFSMIEIKFSFDRLFFIPIK